MADNVAITAGTGTDIAADDISSVKYQRVKLIHGVDGTNDGDVAATNPLPVKSTGYTVSVQAGKTRPADTTAYAAGDVANESTSAGTSISFANCVRANGGSGTILSAFLVSSAGQATKGSFELWLFNADPGADNDNAVFTPTDAEMLTLVGIIPFTVAYVGDATSGAGGNCIYPSTPLSLPFVCGGSTTTLYGVLVVRNAYTPVSAEVFTATLRILQD